MKKTNLDLGIKEGILFQKKLRIKIHYGFYLLTLKKQFPEALEAINNTLKVHPGCLVAHQNKISVLLNEFTDKKMAIQAYRDMKKSAPFHPYTQQESQKFPSLKR